MNDQLSHICKWCNQPSIVIWVHGHGQCSVCGINVDECCRGEEAHPPTSSLKILNDNCKAKFISQSGNVKMLMNNIWRDESRSTFNEKSKDD
jgi:hypothetical protein